MTSQDLAALEQQLTDLADYVGPCRAIMLLAKAAVNIIDSQYTDEQQAYLWDVLGSTFQSMSEPTH